MATTPTRAKHVRARRHGTGWPRPANRPAVRVARRDRGRRTDDTASPDSFVVGDSITMLGAPYLRRLPDWFVYGVGGLNVTRIHKMVSNILSVNQEPGPVVVIALGTNASLLWTKAQLKAAVALLPATTTLALVTTYRDPVKFNLLFPIVGSREWFQPYYIRWVWEADSLRPNTCVVPWRSVVANQPGLLYDESTPPSEDATSGPG